MLNDRGASHARASYQKGPSATRVVTGPVEHAVRLLAELSFSRRTQSDVAITDLADQARRGSERFALFTVAHRAWQRSTCASRHRHQSVSDSGKPKGLLSNTISRKAVASAGADARGASAAGAWRGGAGTLFSSRRGVLLRA